MAFYQGVYQACKEANLSDAWIQKISGALPPPVPRVAAAASRLRALAQPAAQAAKGVAPSTAQHLGSKFPSLAGKGMQTPGLVL
jgi:hypothetical protein